MAKPINTPLLTEMLYGGNAARRREITKLFEEDPAFSKQDRPFLNHTQRYEASIAKCASFHLKCEGLGLKDPMDLRWAYEAVDDILPTDVHMAMFIPALEFQTSEAQKAKWLPLAKSFRILGAYVQTELGHGSNVQALETTATFDSSIDGFVLHTPSLSATKWWPGGLGKTATHAVVHARLLLPSNKEGAKINHKDMGVHAFFVPLRSLETHAPLPGVSLGDIGPKLGFNSIDNGWCRFHKVHVPRDHLLGGVAKVTPSGGYERVQGGEKRMYGAMLDVRANIVSKAAVALAKASVIACRYSMIRQQGYDTVSPTQPPREVAVMEHSTQAVGVLPWLAMAFGLHFTGARFRKQYTAFLEHDPAAPPLPVLHAESSGLKALLTQRVADGIEALRKLCGGHGYSALSGLPELSNNYLALATLEGTQQILEPQAARFLLKPDTKSDDTSSSLPTPNALSASIVAAASNNKAVPAHLLLACLALRERELAKKARHAIATTAQDLGLDEKSAVLRCGVHLGRLSRAHAEWVLLNDFVAATTSSQSADGKNDVLPASLGAPERQVLSDLCHLFGLSLCVGGECLSDLVTLEVIKPVAARALQASMPSAVAKVKPDVAALCDAWDFTDASLNHSAIGAKDGQYVQRLVEYAEREPLNQSDFTGHLKHIQRLTTGRARL